MSRLRELEQCREGDGVGGNSRVEVEAPGLGDDFVGRHADADGGVGQHVGDAVDEGREGAAGVGEDDFAAGVVLQGAGEDEVDGGAARFVGVVEHGLGEGFVDEVAVDGVGGVDEDDGLAGAEGGPDRGEVGMA